MSLTSPHMTIMIQAAEKAARSLLRDFGEVERLQVSKKGPGDFVSKADLRSEEIIGEHLNYARPDYAFLMEESGSIEGENNSEYRWIVDPLDGTTNFLHGIPHWNITIALEKAGEVIAGVVLDPIRDELFRAEKGMGAFMNRTRMRVSGHNDPMASVIHLGYCPMDETGRQRYMDEIMTLQKAGYVHTRRFAACALDMAYVAAGRADAFYERGVQPWDMAAGLILIREAGGVATDINVGNNPFGTNSILCGNASTHQNLAKILDLKNNH